MADRRKKARPTHPRFQSISEAEKHYRRYLIRIGVTTQDRTSFDIAADGLGIDTADEMYELARKNGIRT